MTLFVTASKPTFTAPVTITLPGAADDGAQEVHKVVVEFKRIKRRELLEYMKRNDDIADRIKDQIVGWRNFPDGHGAFVGFTPEALDQLLDIPSSAAALELAFVNESAGAARKN